MKRHTYTNTHTLLHTHRHMHIYTQTYIGPTHINIQTHAHTHTRTHTSYIHTYIHIHTNQVHTHQTHKDIHKPAHAFEHSQTYYTLCIYLDFCGMILDFITSKLIAWNQHGNTYSFHQSTDIVLVKKFAKLDLPKNILL